MSVRGQLGSPALVLVYISSTLRVRKDGKRRGVFAEAALTRETLAIPRSIHFLSSRSLTAPSCFFDRVRLLQRLEASSSFLLLHLLLPVNSRFLRLYTFI